MAWKALEDLVSKFRASAHDRKVRYAAAIMKIEIFYSVAIGQVPPSITTFSELYEYVEAAEFGKQVFDGKKADPSVVLQAQQVVDQWLAADGLTQLMQVAGVDEATIQLQRNQLQGEQ